MEFSVNDPQWVKQRLDHFLQTQLPDLSRTRIQALIKEKAILLNTKPCKANTPLKLGDVVDVEVPEPKPTEILPQDIPLDILFEDEHLLVLNKPIGLVVHPAAGNPDGTLVNALLYHCTNLSGIGGELRPGIVHRLDKETSGCMVVAKHDKVHIALTEAFSQRALQKVYLAVVQSIPRESQGIIKNRMGRHQVDRKRMTIVKEDQGKEAVTHWRTLSTHQGCALIECDLKTGRTHQIRVHMKEALQMAILGDSIYAQTQRQPIKASRLMLHAWKLEFVHPITGEKLAFQAPIPSEFSPWTKGL